MPSRAFIDSDHNARVYANASSKVLMPSRAFIDSDLAYHIGKEGYDPSLNALTGIY